MNNFIDHSIILRNIHCKSEITSFKKNIEKTFLYREELFMYVVFVQELLVKVKRGIMYG